MTTPHWMNSQDGANGTREALKPLQVLDEAKLTEADRKALIADGFNVPFETDLSRGIRKAWDEVFNAR